MNPAYQGAERRTAHPLTDDQINAVAEAAADKALEDQINAVAEAAADKALEKVYGEIGKSVAKGIIWVLGVGALALVAWLGKIGAWK